MAATDLLNLAAAKDVLEYSSTTHDLEISALITGVSQRIDALCGPVVARTISNELHDGGTIKIRPKYTPIFAVTTLVEYDETTGTTLTAETNATKPAEGYILDGVGRHDTYIVRRSANCDYRFEPGRRNIDLTYQAGRFSDTDSVSELFKRAATVFVQHLLGTTAPAWHTNPEWQDETPSQRMRVPGFATPHFVRDMLADELLPVMA